MTPTLRDATAADLEAIRAIYNHAVLHTMAVYDETPRDAVAQAQWFAAKQQGEWPVLVAVAGDSVIGFASYGPFRPWPGFRHTVENALYVAPSWSGRGVGGRLLGALIERARMAGRHAMVAGIDAGNAVSLRLHARFGYREVGRMPEVGHKFGQWRDLVLMQRLL